MRYLVGEKIKVKMSLNPPIYRDATIVEVEPWPRKVIVYFDSPSEPKSKFSWATGEWCIALDSIYRKGDV